MLKIVTFHAAFIPLQGLGSSLPSPCAGKVLAVMEAVLSLARWALCVTRSGVISPIHISNSLGLTPVLMQPVKQKYLTKQCSAGQVHSNRLGTLTGRLWQIPPTFPKGSLLLQDTSCPLWLSPCPGPPAHQGVCAPDRSSSTPAAEQASLCADPQAGQSKLPGLCSDCFGLARKAAMDGCWAMIDASRKGCTQG